MDRRRSLLKIAALRSERERQEGVNIGDRQSVSLSSITAFISAPVPIGTSDFTLEYFGNAYWATSGNSPLIFNSNSRYPYDKGCLLIYGDSKVAVQWVLFEMPSSGASTDDSILLSAGDRETPFHFVVTRKGTTVKAYFNGELKATKEQSAVKDLGDLRLGMSNGSNMVMSRIYNYALSAEEVAALYNDGDPAGYVLPNAMKELTPVEIVGDNSYTWTGEDDSTYAKTINFSQKLSEGRFYRLTITVSNYESGAPFFVANRDSSVYIPAQNGTHIIDVIIDRPYDSLMYIYGGKAGADRRLTLIVNSIEPLGCIAEYLPQNLVLSRKGPDVELAQNVFEFDKGSPYYMQVIPPGRYSFDCVYRVDYVVDEWDYQPAPFNSIGFLGVSGAVVLSGDAEWRTAEAARIGESRSLYVRMPSTGRPRLNLYGAADSEEAIVRRLKVTIGTVTPVSIISLWLDSAKQLPLNDEYLPPLLQSDGGYDLTASGTPEIIIK